MLGEINWRRGSSKDSEEWNSRLKAEEMSSLTPPNAATGGDCYVQQLVLLLKQHRQGRQLDDRIDWLAVDWSQVSHLVNLDISGAGVRQPVFVIELKALMEQYFQMCAQNE